MAAGHATGRTLTLQLERRKEKDDFNPEKDFNPDKDLQRGMKFVAYYPEEHDSAVLVSRVRSSFIDGMSDQSAYNLEYVSSGSTFLYLYVIKHVPDWSPNRLMKALRREGHSPYMTYHEDAESKNAFFIRVLGMFPIETWSNFIRGKSSCMLC